MNKNPSEALMIEYPYGDLYHVIFYYPEHSCELSLLTKVLQVLNRPLGWAWGSLATNSTAPGGEVLYTDPCVIKSTQQLF